MLFKTNMLLSQNKYAIKSKQICSKQILSQNKYAIKSKQICY